DATIDVGAVADMTRIHVMQTAVTAGADATATIWVNLYDPEPDFRTYEVDAEDWSNPIEPEDWSFPITDDGFGMKTFTKQPGETLDYDIDFRPWFEQIPNDEIEDASCTVVSASTSSPSDLTIEQVVRMTNENLIAQANPTLRS